MRVSEEVPKMKISASGQLTIPAELQEELGLLPNTEVTLERDGKALRIKAKSNLEAKNESAVDLLRKARPFFSLSTEEIMIASRGEDWNHP